MIGELLFVFFFNVAAIIAVNRATEYESVNDERNGIIPGSEAGLWFIRYYSIKIFGEHISKTICTCPKCMATVWAIPGYLFFLWAFADFALLWIAFYPFYYLAVSFASHVTGLLTSRLEN